MIGQDGRSGSSEEEEGLSESDHRDEDARLSRIVGEVLRISTENCKANTDSLYFAAVAGRQYYCSVLISQISPNCD